MKNKTYRGFVIAAPPHLNPKKEINRYLFSGSEIQSKESFITMFRVIPMPGFVMPEEFVADVAAQNPLPGTQEVYAPKFNLGKFSYMSASGEERSAQATDAIPLSPEQLRAPQPEEPEKTKEMSDAKEDNPPPPDGPDIDDLF